MRATCPHLMDPITFSGLLLLTLGMLNTYKGRSSEREESCL